MAQKRCYGCMRPKQNSPICEHCGFDENKQNAPHQLPLGAVLRGQYLVGKCLGQGGFGITYLGWDLHLDIPIAIKEYYPNYIVANRDTRQSFALTGVAANMTDLYVSTRQRFLREARVLAKLSTIPNIVRIHNFFEENNTAYIVMEYVKGIDLRQYMNMQGGRLTIQQTLTVLKPLMEAIHQVHQAGIVHRDISPDNIMLMADGTPKLLDFGAVRNMESSDADQELQHSTEAILKHGFAPMEQYQKRGALGPWTDEYALCATIYYCLTGRVPPDAPQRMTEDVHPQWDTIPGLTPRQIEVLEKGMAPRGKDRYGSIGELMTALYGEAPAPAVSQPAVSMPKEEPSANAQAPALTIHLSPTPDAPPKQPRKKKKGKGLVVAAALGLVAVAAAAAALLLTKEPRKQPQLASEPTASQAVTVPSATTEPSKTPEIPAEPSLPPEPTETTEAPTQPTEPPVWIDNVLISNSFEGCGSPYANAFGTWITKGSIRSVTFLDTLKDAPETGCWDVSENQDGSVIAWAFQSGGKYDMYIAAEGGINAKHCAIMFYFFTSLETVDFGTAFHTDYADNFDRMFNECPKLQELDLSSFNTANATIMSGMFRNCENLASVNVNGWDTSNVTTMAEMFRGCNNMTNLEITGWDLTSLTNYSDFMTEAQTINGQPWEDVFMYRTVIFDDDNSYANELWTDNILMAQKLPYGNYWEEIGQTTPAFGTPLERSSIRSITFLDTLKDAPADTWDVSAAQNGSVLAWAEYDEASEMYDMFIAGEGGVRASSCAALFNSFDELEIVDFGTAFHIEGISSTTSMFEGCTSLRELDLSNFDTSQVADMSSMFRRCESLTDPNTSGWDTSGVTKMTQMFQFCNSLTTLDLSHFNTSNVTSTQGMFGSCDSLEYFDFSGFETDSLTHVAIMFYECPKLKNLEITDWDTSKVVSCDGFMDTGDTINGNPWGVFFP